MSDFNCKEYFSKKVNTHGDSVMTSDYIDEKSFYTQRDNTLRWLGQLKNCEILDAGCGVGSFSETLVKENTVYGVDLNEKILEFAKKKGLNTHCGDLSVLPFDNGKFDVILCIGVFQLMKEYEDVLKELVRVLKPGGTLVVETLNKDSLLRKIYLKLKKENNFARMYSKLELKKAFENFGFKNIEFMSVYHPTSFVTFKKGEGCIDKYLGTSFAIKGIK